MADPMLFMKLEIGVPITNDNEMKEAIQQAVNAATRVGVQIKFILSSNMTMWVYPNDDVNELFSEWQKRDYKSNSSVHTTINVPRRSQ